MPSNKGAHHLHAIHAGLAVPGRQRVLKNPCFMHYVAPNVVGVKSNLWSFTKRTNGLSSAWCVLCCARLQLPAIAWDAAVKCIMCCVVQDCMALRSHESWVGPKLLPHPDRYAVYTTFCISAVSACGAPKKGTLFAPVGYPVPATSRLYLEYCTALQAPVTIR